MRSDSNSYSQVKGGDGEGGGRVERAECREWRGAKG